MYILVMVAKPKTQPTDLSAVQKIWKSFWLLAQTLYLPVGPTALKPSTPKEEAKFDIDIYPVNDFPTEDDASIFTTDRSRLRSATGNNLLYASNDAMILSMPIKAAPRNRFSGSFSKSFSQKSRMKNRAAGRNLLSAPLMNEIHPTVTTSLKNGLTPFSNRSEKNRGSKDCLMMWLRTSAFNPMS